MSQRHKSGRAIVVTTDFCEEAESSGDFIGILDKRTIPYCLPPYDLLFSLCGGYTISIHLAQSGRATGDAVFDFVQRLAEKVQVQVSLAGLCTPVLYLPPSMNRYSTPVHGAAVSNTVCNVVGNASCTNVLIRK